MGSDAHGCLFLELANGHITFALHVASTSHNYSVDIKLATCSKSKDSEARRRKVVLADHLIIRTFHLSGVLQVQGGPDNGGATSRKVPMVQLINLRASVTVACLSVCLSVTAQFGLPGDLYITILRIYTRSIETKA